MAGARFLMQDTIQAPLVKEGPPDTTIVDAAVGMSGGQLESSLEFAYKSEVNPVEGAGILLFEGTSIKEDEIWFKLPVLTDPLLFPSCELFGEENSRLLQCVLRTCF
ncbi:MAG: hypothetical protein O4808_13890 [Trichodesmium sp. St17_bin3_1_1]|nr:hypothetical protein [Trichodesmium sp. St17_bin3_1_1]